MFYTSFLKYVGGHILLPGLCHFMDKFGNYGIYKGNYYISI